jgi:hypothetical protein
MVGRKNPPYASANALTSPAKIPGFGFPSRMLCNLRYHETGTLSSTAGSLGSNLFRWNSTFDPNFTFVGHQPLYRDVYAGIYDHYAVIRATALIKIMNTDDSPVIVGVVTEDDSTITSQVDVLCEQNYGQHIILPPISGSLSSHTFSVAWDCKKVLGIDPYGSEAYKTPVGSNPSEESYLVLWGASTDTSNATVTYDLEIIYEVLWSELSTPTLN